MFEKFAIVLSEVLLIPVHVKCLGRILCETFKKPLKLFWNVDPLQCAYSAYIIIINYFIYQA